MGLASVVIIQWMSARYLATLPMVLLNCSLFIHDALSATTCLLRP